MKERVGLADAATLTAVPSTMVPSTGERISRKDAATLARCSEDTIKRDIKDNGLVTTTGPGGCGLVAVADLIAIGRVKAADLEIPGHGSQSVEVRRAQAESARLATENGRLAGAADAHEMHLDVLRSQLREKDKQISELHKTLERTYAFARATTGMSA